MIVYDNTGFVNLDKSFSGFVTEDGIEFSSSNNDNEITFNYDSEEEAQEEMLSMMRAFDNKHSFYLMRLSSDYKTYLEESKENRRKKKEEEQNQDFPGRDQSSGKVITNFEPLA